MTFEEISKLLFNLIPKNEIDKRLGTLGEFCYSFPGFIDTYYHLSFIIPTNFTVLDFGAGYNSQSYFFLNHKKYIAISPHSVTEDDGIFCPPNCEVYRMTTGEYLRNVNYPKGDDVFAICNCVPNWHKENSVDLVRLNFKNCFTLYPSSEHVNINFININK